MKTFEVGDVVELKSGSPKMTCSEKPDTTMQSNFVYCEWFVENSTHSGPNNRWFPEETLKKVDK